MFELRGGEVGAMTPNVMRMETIAWISRISMWHGMEGQGVAGVGKLEERTNEVSGLGCGRYADMQMGLTPHASSRALPFDIGMTFHDEPFPDEEYSCGSMKYSSGSTVVVVQ